MTTIPNQELTDDQRLENLAILLESLVPVRAAAEATGEAEVVLAIDHLAHVALLRMERIRPGSLEQIPFQDEPEPSVLSKIYVVRNKP